MPFKTMKLRFAVIGTNFISDWVIAGARQDPRFELAAVYSRQQSTATYFADKHAIPLTFTSLEELATSTEVDAVYIASPNSHHASQSILMMRHGKHVLCEKPLAANTHEVKMMIETARETGVTLMEAMKPTLTPNFAAVMENVHRVGKVRQYFSSFCQYSSRYDRFKAGELLNAFNPELASGAIMDLGVYTIYPLIVLFGRPLRVQASSTLLSTGVDGAGAIIMDYPDFTATVLYSKIADAYLPTEIQGEEGTITLDRVNIIRDVTFRPRKFASSGIGPASEPELLTRPTPYDEYYYEIREFIDLVEQGRQQSSINTWDASLATMEVIEIVR
jgi:predicted dehydrogenase